MNPVKVIFSILAVGFAVAVLLGVVGLNYLETAGENAEQAEGNGGDTAQTAEGELPDYMQQCLSCHGTDLTGASAPDLTNLALSKDEIVDILKNGKGGMPPGLVPGNEAAVADYLLSLKEE